MKISKCLLLLVLGGWGLLNVSSPSLSEMPEGNSATATFAGGCFWCMEGPFDELDGVLSTTSGYTGGYTANPTYAQVSAGVTGHAEAVEVAYDPQRISYQELLTVYWRNIDPTTPNGQFCDHGDQYRPAIFYHNEAQRRLAEASKEEIERTKTFSAPIVTEITQATEFYPAEEHHQDYYRKNPIRYKFYRLTCGRDARLTELWGSDRERHGHLKVVDKPTA